MDLWRLIRNQWDRAVAVAAAVIGLIAVLLGWLGVSGKDLPAAQIPYLVSGGVFGIFMLGIAATMWLSADLRDEWRKLDEIHRVVSSADAKATVQGEDLPEPTTTAAVKAAPKPRAKRAVAKETPARASSRP